jgi:heptosyltransferase-2
MSRRVDPSHFRRILVRSANWIGDAVMSLPALEALRRSAPNAEIVVASKPWVSELYWHHPAVHRVLVYDPAHEHRGPRGFWKFAQTLREAEFDAAVLFPNSFHAALMVWAAGIPVRVGYARDGRGPLLTEAVEAPPPAFYGHQTSYYLQLLFRAGWTERPERVGEIRLALEGTEHKWAERQLSRLGLAGPRFLVGLNPGAAFGPAKRWPLERYAQLADRLIGGLDADVLIFGSRAERPMAEEIARAMTHTPTVLAGDTSLRQLMAMMARCRLLVTNDSGPMHVAAALGLPVVALFGSTDERATGPVGPRVRVLRHAVECSPCGLRECPIDFRCMNGLDVDRVYRSALELAKSAGILDESR